MHVCVYTHTYIERERFFQIPFHYRFIQDTKYSSLCSIVGLCCFVSLNLKLLIYLSSLPSPLFPLVTIRLFSMSVNIFLFENSSSVLFSSFSVWLIQLVWSFPGSQITVFSLCAYVGFPHRQTYEKRPLIVQD